MRPIVTAFFLFALVAIVAIGQENPRETIKTLDDYCIVMSKRVDAMDKSANDTDSILPQLPADKRAQVVEYVKSLRALHRAIRQDACDAKDLKSARLATRRDLNKSSLLINEMLAFVNHNLAEAYREKAHSDESSK